MKEREKIDELDALHYIKQVEAPEFLFTRIEQKIKTKKMLKCLYGLCMQLAHQ